MLNRAGAAPLHDDDNGAIHDAALRSPIARSAILPRLSSSWIQWDIRNPDGGATGLEFARARTAIREHVLVHAAPSRIDVEVRDSDGRTIASAHDLEAAGSTPISRLRIQDDRLTRENIWPGPEDLGLVVLLPGGEAGTLESWWHAEDHSEWRWTMELRNHV